jgi:hypothetical protein
MAKKKAKKPAKKPSKKKPAPKRDVNQLAAQIVKQATSRG